jgi:hypothetical protein
MGCNDGDTIAVDEEIRNGTDKRREKRRMEMSLGLIHEHQRAFLHTLNKLGDSQKNDLVARAQLTE